MHESVWGEVGEEVGEEVDGCRYVCVYERELLQIQIYLHI